MNFSCQNTIHQYFTNFKQKMKKYAPMEHFDWNINTFQVINKYDGPEL